MAREGEEPALTVTEGLLAITRQLDEAAAIAHAALACARKGSPDAAVRILLDAEEPVREAGTLLKVVALIQRLHEARQEGGVTRPGG